MKLTSDKYPFEDMARDLAATVVFLDQSDEAEYCEKGRLGRALVFHALEDDLEKLADKLIGI